MPSLPITSMCAGIFALMLVVLSFQVSLRRVKLGGVDFGDGNDVVLRRRIRAHGNFVEYVPLALLLIALLEFQGGSARLVIGVGTAFLATRVLHAVGILFTETPTLRAIAMMAQHATFLVAAVWLFAHALRPST